MMCYVMVPLFTVDRLARPCYNAGLRRAPSSQPGARPGQGGSQQWHCRGHAVAFAMSRPPPKQMEQPMEGEEGRPDAGRAAGSRIGQPWRQIRAAAPAGPPVRRRGPRATAGAEPVARQWSRLAGF